MASPNNQTIPIEVLSTAHGYNCAYVITQGDANAYTLTITYSDIEAFDGTVMLRFVMPDGTYHDRDDSDGVTVDGNVISYLMTEADYAQRGMVCYVRHLDSTTIHTTLEITFSQIRALEGEVAGTDTTSYPTWVADMRDFDVAIGTVETLDPGADATASITGDVPDKVLNLGIPKGDTGDAATIAVGTVSTLAAGESATVSNSGTTGAAVLDFGIPKGDKGDTGEMTIGTVTTLDPGESATVENVGTSTDAVLNIGIPAGYDGSAVPIDDASSAADRVWSASKITAQLSAIDTHLEDKAEKTEIGLLSGLLTTVKTSIVNAINELFNSKANKVQEAWIYPVLINGWSNYEGQELKYYKDSMGIVHVVGRVRNGVAGSTLSTLPVGYRPTENIYFPTAVSGSSATVGKGLVWANGNITLYNVNLDTSINISFRGA